MNRFFHNTIREIWRYPLRLSMKMRNKNKDIRILSSNCVGGGVLLHDLCLPFNSPTVNLIIDDMDFLNLCRHPEMYLKESPVFECMSEYGFPIAILRDIRVQCVHYESFEQFKEQWQRRSRRFLMHEDSEIFVIATDSQLRTDEAIEAFHQLPYRKVCFTGSEKISYEEFIYIPGCKSGVTGDLTKYVDYKGTRVFEKYFDCIRWLNEDGL